MRIAIINVGAPAGGMNAAMQGAVSYCLARGHTPVAIHNGFSGFVRHHSDKPLGSVRELTWLDTEGWVSQGGTEIGTNRTLPNDSDITMVKTAECFALFNFNALFVIGGFEAFTAVSQLRKARPEYPSLRIPMVLLPATVSNNVPGTEYSLGSDTCLNALVTFCDSIRQSASSSRRRVFVVETQGGRSGYIATMAGLDIGAVAVYTPEEGITIKMLAQDIEHLRKSFAQDRGEDRSGRLILCSEHASDAYDAQKIANMIREEAKGRFDSRHAVPGHWQQGNAPSPMDRVRAIRLATKCVQYLEEYVGMTPDAIADDRKSAAVIGIRGVSVIFSEMERLEKEETNWKDRRPKNEFWLGLKKIVDTLSGRPQIGEYCAVCGDGCKKKN